MHIVFSLGGSLLNTAQGIDKAFLERMARLLMASPHSFGIVTGGGYRARQYADAVRARGGNEFEADEAAIEATKENAKALIGGLGKKACPKVCETFDEARTAAKRYGIVVMGGTIPGITTDADAVLLAEALHAARVINISNVDAIYDSDPRKNKDAKKFSKMAHAQLIELAVRSDERKAGTHFVFDLLACKLAARSKMEVHFVGGKDWGDLEKAIDGKAHGGTLVK